MNKTFAQRRTCDHYSHVSSTYPKFVDNHQAQHKLAKVSPGHDVLDIGVNDWQLPFPLMQVNRRWQFDSCAGAQEIVNRRIGRNEIAAIRVALTYVDAQRDYFERTKQNGGTGEYAQRLISTPDGHDGLYGPPRRTSPKARSASWSRRRWRKATRATSPPNGKSRIKGIIPAVEKIDPSTAPSVMAAPRPP